MAAIRKRKAEMKSADYAALRADIKKNAPAEGGLKVYLTGDQPAYRLGVLYPPNSVIRLPAEEDPSHTWKPYSATKAAAAPVAPAAGGEQNREL